MRYFCTLFDKNYLYKGLAMYGSLRRHAPDSVLWILCMDTDTYDLLSEMRLPGVRLITLEAFEDPALQKAKSERQLVEYYWTCTPSLPLYILNNNPTLDAITYVDADLYFYSSLEPIYEELGRNSILIIPHRFTPQTYYFEKESGIFNVGLLVFKNDDRGRTCLAWWRERCLEWCFARYEDGKFGDQLYLNDWPTRFSGVCVLEHIGADVAPWNVAQYQIGKKKEDTYINETPLIFYHFHALRIYPDGTFLACSADHHLPDACLMHIYTPYYAELTQVIESVKKQNSRFIFGFSSKPPLWIRCKQLIKKILHL